MHGSKFIQGKRCSLKKWVPTGLLAASNFELSSNTRRLKFVLAYVRKQYDTNVYGKSIALLRNHMHHTSKIYSIYPREPRNTTNKIIRQRVDSVTQRFFSKVINSYFVSELCWGKAVVANTKLQQRKKEESKRLRGEGDKIKFAISEMG